MENGGKREGAGRPKGVPNKDKRELLDMIQKEFPNYHPVLAMAALANDTTKVTKNGIEVNVIDDNLRLQANKEVAKYIVPQLKAIEHRGDNSIPLPIITLTPHLNGASEN